MIIYPPPPIFSPSLWMLPGDSSDVGGSAHHVPRAPLADRILICCVEDLFSPACENCFGSTVHGTFGQEDTHLGQSMLRAGTQTLGEIRDRCRPQTLTWDGARSGHSGRSNDVSV